MIKQPKARLGIISKETKGDIRARVILAGIERNRMIQAAITMGADDIGAFSEGVFEHERITAANDSLITQATYQEPLTQFIVGARDDQDLDALLDAFAPPVQVPQRFEYAATDTDHEFYAGATDEDLRAIGADFARFGEKSTKVTAKTVSRGLAIDVDLDEVAPGDNTWQERAAQKILRRLKRLQLRRAVAALTAAATNTAKTWGSSADPDGDVLAEMNTAAGITGMEPTTLIFGRTAWNTRFTSNRSQNTAGSNASAALTPQQVAELVGAQRGLIADARYTSAANTKSLVVSTKLFIFMAEQGVDAMDPSNIKLFWTPVDGDQRYSVLTRPVGDRKFRVIVHHKELIKIPHSYGIRTLTIS